MSEPKLALMTVRTLLEGAGKILNNIILATPTGPVRNVMTEANMEIMRAQTALEQITRQVK